MSAPRRAPPRMLTVLGAEAVTPRVRRIRLGGPGLLGLDDAWPGAHLKLFFPRAGQAEPVLPMVEGQTVRWPVPELRPVVRTYSLRAYELSGPEPYLEVDFVLHTPHGPASAWAVSAAPGARLGLAGPGGPRSILAGRGPYLLAGDASALPAMAAQLEAMPSDARGVCFVSIPSEAERQRIVHPPGVTLTWLVAGTPGSPATDLVTRVLEAPAQLGVRRLWLAGEDAQVRALRDPLMVRFGLRPSDVYAVPYWKERASEEEYHAERHRVMDELSERAP